MKIKLVTKIVFFVSLALGLIGMIGIVADAMTSQNIAVGWVMLSFIIAGTAGLVAAIVLVIVANKDKIKSFFRKYR